MTEYLDRPANGMFNTLAKGQRQMDLVGKFWNHIERNLRAVLLKDEASQTHKMEFAGGTLCICSMKSIYMLKVNGVGSINPIDRPLLKNSKVIQPDYITRLVQKVYIQTKGVTEYYRENAKKYDGKVLIV